MCLSTVTPISLPNEGTAFKVRGRDGYSWVRPTHPCQIKQGTILKLSNQPKTTSILYAQDNTEYPTGFHISTDESDAHNNAHIPGDQVWKISYKGILAQGTERQSNNPVLIVQEITFMELLQTAEK